MEMSSLKFLQNRIKELGTLTSYQSNNTNTLEELNIESMGLDNIQSLSLSCNQLTIISNSFLSLEKLIILNLSHNQILTIDNLNNCTNLEFLNLSHNQLKSVCLTLSSLRKLYHCDLSFNLIKYHKSIVKCFKFNPVLTSLCLKGNPDYNWEDCKYTCLETLPRLNYLDHKEIYPHVKKTQVKGNTITLKTLDGEVKEIQSVKEYIKFRLNHMKHTKTKNLSPSNKFKDNYKSCYYYLNK